MPATRPSQTKAKTTTGTEPASPQKHPRPVTRSARIEEINMTDTQSAAGATSVEL